MSPTPADPGSLDAQETTLVERLAEEMARRWRAGDRALAEDYLALYPELAEIPDRALELIAEEIVLRQEAGDEPEAEEFTNRFPQWRRQVQALVECHQLMAAEWRPPRFPVSGETLGAFRLLAELGRGGHGRVFLATQPALADRSVVLKLGPATSLEHLSLSRLQHTHIVPLYSVHNFPARNLRGLCLPYFGGATLADLLLKLDAVPAARRTGADLLLALEWCQPTGSVAVPIQGPACRFLAKVSYVHAVCWLGACLADALHFAHERGLLHLDVKPSNVLLAADGQPMLLDFHMARPPLAANAMVPAGLGGTPGFMAPEHQAAMAAVTACRPLSVPVDCRADVYCLGVLLASLLGLENGGQATVTRLRKVNARVTQGLADLVGRCVASNPADRYPSAGELAADLRRHLANQPLRGVANRSMLERWHKWRRRRPLVLPFFVAIITGILASACWVGHMARQARAAENALQQGEQHLARQHFGAALEAFHGGAALAEGLPFNGALLERLQYGARQADQGRAAGELHKLCERVRAAYAANDLTADQAREVEDHCRNLWGQRERIVERLRRQSDQELDQQVQADLLDLAILWADLHARTAPPSDARASRAEALAVLDEAEALLGPSCVLARERLIHALALAQPEIAAAATRQCAELAPRGAWEHYALGRALLHSDDLHAAAEQLDLAVELTPQSLWPNFTRGLCAFRAGRYEDALAAFSACAALAPDVAACFANRGRAYAQLGHLEEALRDYDQALKLDAGRPATAIARADACRRLGRFKDALSDLEKAQHSGARGSDICYHRALIYLAQEERAAAEEALRAALELDSTNEAARELLNRLKSPR